MIRQKKLPFLLIISLSATVSRIAIAEKGEISGKTSIEALGPFDTQIDELEKENIKLERDMQEIELKIKEIKDSIEDKQLESTLMKITLVLDDMDKDHTNFIKISINGDLVYQTTKDEGLIYADNQLTLYNGPFLTGPHKIITTIETVDKKELKKNSLKFMKKTTREFSFYVEDSEEITQLKIYPKTAPSADSESNITYTLN